MQGSIEERVLQIQEDKRKLMMLAFAERESKRGKKSETSVAQIARLLSSTKAMSSEAT
jgi:SWI/SNF-related matrix-associated actin-dependent regulator of chromatin subfamily A3